MNNKTKGLIAGILGNTIFGFSLLSSTIAFKYVSPLVLLTGRFVVAFVVFSILILLRVIKIDYKGKKWWKLIIIGILQPLLYFVCENYGLKYTNSSISGTFLALVPVVCFFTGFLFLKERFKTKQFIFCVVSVFGVFLLSMNGDGTKSTFLGILLLIGAVVTAALFNTVSRQCASEFSAYDRTYMMFIIGAIGFTSMSMIETKGRSFAILANSLTHVDFLLAFLFLSVLSSVVAFLLINVAVDNLPIRVSSTFASIITVIAVIAGILFLHEQIGVVEIIGMVIVIFGVFMVNYLDE